MPCWIGVDLASRDDLAAVVAVFVRDGEVWVKPRFYLPGHMVEVGGATMAHYRGWAAAGHLNLTEGNLIDFGVIRADLLALASRVHLQEIDFDPFQSTYLKSELEHDGLPNLVDITQNVKRLSGPMKTVRALLKDGKLHHDGNPVMAWCVSNVVAKEDVNENVFPRKAARHLKIDGFSALLDALAGAGERPAKDPMDHYDTHDVRMA